MTDFDVLTAANLKRWANAKLTRAALGDSIAKRLVAAKQRYKTVEAKTGVPWFVIAVIHERESSQNWMRSLAQGDPWNEVSVRIPSGRGPFRSWEEAAIDALANCHPFLARRKDWSLAGILIALEMYNGLGYSNRGVPSPYLWAGTDQYVRGKFVVDGRYDSQALDQQMGCAALLKAMMSIDPTISFTGSVLTPVAPVEPTKPSVTNPSKGSIGAFIASIFNAIFRKKS